MLSGNSPQNYGHIKEYSLHEQRANLKVLRPIVLTVHVCIIPVTQHFSWQTAVLVLLYIFVKYRTFTRDDHNLEVNCFGVCEGSAVLYGRKRNLCGLVR